MNVNNGGGRREFGRAEAPYLLLGAEIGRRFGERYNHGVVGAVAGAVAGGAVLRAYQSYQQRAAQAAQEQGAQADARAPQEEPVLLAAENADFVQRAAQNVQAAQGEDAQNEQQEGVARERAAWSERDAVVWQAQVKIRKAMRAACHQYDRSRRSGR